MGAARNNRATLIGLGGWGCRVLAHLWPRLRQADERRSLVTPDLTPIHHAVSFALVMPDEAGRLTIAQPRPDQWDTSEFARASWYALTQGRDEGPRSSGAWREETYRRLEDTLEVLQSFAPSANPPRMGRQALLHTLSAHEQAISRQLTWLIDQARIDRGEPASEIAKLTIYVLASLAEDVASVLIWPLAAMIRQTAGEYTPIEVVGLFLADTFASSPDRSYEMAAIHLALQEMAILESPDPEQQAAVREALPQARWLEALGTHPLDYRYLLGREKLGGTIAEGEGEVITTVGNALEAFLVSDADRFLSERLAPDLPTLQGLGGYSSLGAASIYVPVGVMRARSRDQVRLQLLQEQFLASPVPEQTQQIEQLAKTLGRDLLSVKQLEHALVGDGPIELDVASFDPSKGPLIPVRLRYGELRPPLSGTEGLGPAARLESIQQHFAQLEGARLPRWRQELLVRAGVIPTPDTDEDAGEAAQEEDEEAHVPPPGRTAAYHLLEQMDQILLDLIREGGRGGLRMALQCAQAVAEQVQRDGARLSAQRSQMAMPPTLRNLSSSAEVNRLTRIIDRWLAVQSRPWWVLLASLVLSLVAAIVLARSTGMRPGELQASGLVQLLAGALVASGLIGAGVLALAHWQLEHLTERLIWAKASVINRQLNDQVYELTVSAHALLREGALKRARCLQRTLADLEAERARLAAALARPMRMDASFVRIAILDDAIYDGIWARAQRWISGDVTPRLWAGESDLVDELRVAWADTLAGGTAEPAPVQAAWRPASGDAGDGEIRAPLAEAISAAVARYAALVARPYLPREASIESSLMRVRRPGSDGRGVDVSWQLDDLCMRARPFISVEETEADSGPLVSIDIAAVPPSMSRWLGRETGAALHVHPVPSSDPFSITVVRTLHGLCGDRLPQLRRYADAFEYLDAEARSRLLISPVFIEKQASAAVETAQGTGCEPTPDETTPETSSPVA
ncbi:MAG: hypothetical protein J7M34_09920 [Anaerolineae bacterium]|nr:hypothetical protein [Anaerolineae bacterium]